MNVLSRPSYRLRMLLPCLVIPLLWGCSEGGTASSTVSGKVSLNGHPVESGTVLLISAKGEAASAPLSPEGTYQLKCLPGVYQVAVNPPPPADPMIKSPGPVPAPTPAIPSRYQDVNTSGLKTDVSTGTNTFNIEMQAVEKGR